MPDAWDAAEETSDVVGMLDEYADVLVRARGRLYDFHQLVGTADALLSKVAEGMDTTGEEDLAARVRRRLLGRNVVPGMWSFELVEAFERTYLDVAEDVVAELRGALADGRRHTHEARMKRRRRRDGPRDDVADGTSTGSSDPQV